MINNLKNKVGINLVNEDNLAILKDPYSIEKYMEDVVNTRLKVLPEFEDNVYHFITGLTSEFIELLFPFQELHSLARFHNILAKDLSQYTDNLLWNLLEEMGDYQFFRNGLVQQMEIEPREIGLISNYESLVNIINNELTNICDTQLPLYAVTFGESMGLQTIILKLIECMVSSMKKNIVSGKETTFEMMREKIESILYCFDSCFQFVLQLTDEMTCRLAVSMIQTEEERVILFGENSELVDPMDGSFSLINMNSIYRINDLKLSRRYKGTFTNEESEDRDYDNEKVLEN